MKFEEPLSPAIRFAEKIYSKLKGIGFILFWTMSASIYLVFFTFSIYYWLLANSPFLLFIKSFIVMLIIIFITLFLLDYWYGKNLNRTSQVFLVSLLATIIIFPIYSYSLLQIQIIYSNFMLNLLTNLNKKIGITGPMAILKNLVIYFGYLLGFLAPYVFYKTIKLNKYIGSWRYEFYKFSYRLNFEITPSSGETPEERILNHLSLTYSELEEKIEKYPEEIKFNEIIDGKKEQHQFNIYIENVIRPLLAKKQSLFVKIFDKNGPVDAKDLNKLREEIIDVIKNKRTTTFGIVVVSTSSFTEDALEFAKNKKNFIDHVSFTLILDEKKGYRVIWL